MYKIIGADQKEYGPVSEDELRKWIAEGRANAQTLVQEDGGSWKPLASFPVFALNRPAESVPSAPPPPALAPGVIAAPPSPGASPGSGSNVFAVLGLVMGIISATVGLCCCYGLPFNVLGIVFSAVALAQIRNHPAEYHGKGLAIAGLVLSILSLLVAGLLLAIGVAISWEDIMRNLKR